MHEEDVLGKAYDSRLMRRLLTYLRPYRSQVALAITAIVVAFAATALAIALVVRLFELTGQATLSPDDPASASRDNSNS